MSGVGVKEATVEDAALAYLESLGWTMAPSAAAAERTDYGQVVLEHRLRDALARLNPALPASALDDARRKLTRPEGATLETRNRAFHLMLVNGVPVEYRASDGSVRGARARVVNFDDAAANDWLAVNQFTVTENRYTRRPDIALYRELVRLRPDWHSEDDMQGAVKVVMTGAASDPLQWQPHIRNKPRREALAKRFRAAADPFRIVLVRDLWLTGFDAPSLHTMYVDKPMRGHGLMQAVARVNRVFKDKPGGLVVDYPPDQQGNAPQTVLAQAEVLSEGWSL